MKNKMVKALAIMMSVSTITMIGFRKRICFRD